jgi:hypothetical protein
LELHQVQNLFENCAVVVENWAAVAAAGPQVFDEEYPVAASEKEREERELRSYLACE